jgi:hypothetical protein
MTKKKTRKKTEEKPTAPKTKRVKMRHTKILQRPRGGTETYVVGFYYNVDLETFAKLKPYIVKE